GGDQRRPGGVARRVAPERLRPRPGGQARPAPGDRETRGGVRRPTEGQAMSYTVEALSDRLEIQDLITAYSYAIDFHRFDDLDAIFTPDATPDFTATGGTAGPLP